MNRFPASPRASRAEDMTGLEYGLVAAFVLVALFAAIPAVPPALAAAAEALLHHLA